MSSSRRPDDSAGGAKPRNVGVERGGAPARVGDEHLIGEHTLADGRSVKFFETEKAYHVPDLVTEKEPNGIRIGKSILQHEITPDQAVKLVSLGKTDLIKGFVSNRTKRKFDAFLTFDAKEGKIGFDFPPRPAKKAAKAKE